VVTRERCRRAGCVCRTPVRPENGVIAGQKPPTCTPCLSEMQHYYPRFTLRALISIERDKGCFGAFPLVNERGLFQVFT
jgi:hypothetical protein